MLYQPTLASALLTGSLLLALEAEGQTAPSRIELAQTDGQVEQLVKSMDSYYANFKVNSALKFADKRVEKQYRRAHVKAWQKADFDGNGRLDLLITGTHHDAKSKVICLLDMGDKLVLEPFSRQFYRACPVATLRYEGTQPCIDYADFSKPFLATDKLQDKKSFRLIYKYGGFIELNPQANPQAVADSILYKSFFVYHQSQEEKLTVTGTGAATYYSRTYPVLDSTKIIRVSQQTVVDAHALADIQGMAGYLAGQSLQPQYRTGFNHVPHTTLTIAYHGGQRLRIQDDGEIGTFGLMRLYALLAQLRETQAWQPTKP